MRWSHLDSLKGIVSEAPVIMTMTALDGTILAVSGPGTLSLGMPAEEAIGRRVHELFPNGRETFEELKAAGAWERGVSLPIRSDLRPDGSQFWYQMSSWPFRGDTGEVAGLIHQVRDVSIEERALQELNLAEALLEAAIESMPSMLGVIDLQAGTITRVNRAFEDFVGLSRQQIVGRRPSGNFTEEDVREIEERKAEAIATGKLIVSERELRDGRGRPRVILRRLQAIEDRIGRKYLMLVMDDVTAARHAERVLQGALADAEAANEAKSSFLALISHEIRTPLNGVLGMAQAMARDALSPPQRERLDLIQASGEALLAILNDLLDLSKIEAGQLELEQIDFDLAGALRATARGFSALAASKGLTCVVDIDEVEGVYRGDPTRVRQIVSNLISNAIKFTETGEVRLQARRQDRDVVLSVTDTGAGISREAMARLFQKFAQADSSTTRRFGGTGLGLAICRQLAELMGGTIEARSKLGQGACFTVRLPLEQTADRQAPASSRLEPDDIAFGDLRILAAEDNPTNQRVLAALLEQAGLSLEMAANGLEALEAFKRQPWDIVLMDVQMPVMDGPTAVAEIRKFERETGRAPTPVIALTANVMEHQKAAYLTCGMDGVVGKPLRVGELFSAIQDLVRRPEEIVSPPERARIRTR